METVETQAMMTDGVFVFVENYKSIIVGPLNSGGAQAANCVFPFCCLTYIVHICAYTDSYTQTRRHTHTHTHTHTHKNTHIDTCTWRYLFVKQIRF